jgi:hypothetical protein
MPLNRYTVGGALIALLVLANIFNLIFAGWGLITVRVQGAPLGQVIKSIERQGHVTLYTNLDPASPVTMNVIKVSLPEALESLAQNCTPGEGRGGAQWKLTFFTAPSSAAVKQEIRSFEAGSLGDDFKTYSYPTPLQMLATDESLPAADPRKQTWPGLKPAPAAPAPAPAPADGPAGDDQAATAPEPPSSVQGYLDALAQAADIMILAPASWDPKISGPPGPSSSIAKAVGSVVGSGRGAVEQAFVLMDRARGPRGPGGGRGFFGDNNWAAMDDRTDNAINGLPADYQAAARTQLAQEKAFHQQLAAAPPDQRRDLMRKHRMDHLGAFDNWRRSPEKRAQMYQHLVSNRQSVRGN